MIEAIILYLQSVLQASNYFERVFPLCEIIENSTEKKPAHYKCLGQFEDINIDHENGTAYFLRDGDPTFTNYTGPLSNNSCSAFTLAKFPLKAILTVPKAKLSTDDEYTDDRIAQTLIALIGNNTASLRAGIKAQDVNIFCPKYSTNKLSILKDQYGANATREPNYRLAYLSLSLSAEVIINTDCITKECDVNPENFVFEALTTFCAAVANCSIIEQILIDIQNIVTEGLTPLTFTGAINDVNTVFTFSQVPTIIFWNNSKLVLNAVSNGYTLAGNVATFTNAPFIGDTIEAYK